MGTYTVVGAGAVGLLYGTRLADAGHTVHWVVRSGSDQVRRDGIRVCSEGRTVEISPADAIVVDDPAHAPPADTVIVALKTTANASLADLVGPAVRPGATVAVFQNGLGVEAAARAAVPHAGGVLGAMCFVCAHRVAPGRADHLDYGAVTVGALDASPTETSRLVDDLRGAGLPASAVDDLDVARWRKLVWNIPFNGLSVVLDATTDQLLGDAATRGLIADLMDEVIAAARACGAPVDPAFREEMLQTTDAMTPYAPSMKLDADAGRPMEIGAIYDTPVEVARRAGRPMPKVEVLAQQLRFLDATTTTVEA